MADFDRYSNVSDLLVGDITVDDATKTRHVTDAADEVDSRLGFLYHTPFVESDLSTAGWKLVRRISNFIASGRLLMEIDQAGENQMVHAYGMSLLKQADDAIAKILSGDVDLYPENPLDPSRKQIHGMLVGNVDPYSSVEAFYGWAATPGVPMRPGGWPGAY